MNSHLIIAIIVSLIGIFLGRLVIVLIRSSKKYPTSLGILYLMLSALVIVVALTWWSYFG